MTGFGRTGSWFACQHWDVVPDIIVTAKGLTGALIPLGAVIVSGKIADAFENRMLYAGLTYLGHTLACAAGVAALEAYEQENLIEHSRVLGDRMLARLREMQTRHPSIGEVRGKGLFAAVELVKDRQSREPFVPFNVDSPVLGRIAREAKERGVIFMARWNYFVLAPPLVITETELDRALDMLDELLVYADAEVTSA
jgi:taurine--2-oxoglutarate transaminase